MSTRYSARFLDGPASKKVLSLRRAPLLLRVTLKDGKFDALDLLDDKPEAGEAVHVYQWKENEGSALVDGRDPVTGKRGGWTEQMVVYALCDEQPADDVMRDNALWQQWAKDYSDACKDPD